MSKNVVILGTQWGDEGKGKLVDLLCEQAAAVHPSLGTRTTGSSRMLASASDRSSAGGDAHVNGFPGIIYGWRAAPAARALSAFSAS